jgi:hypothetical protein
MKPRVLDLFCGAGGAAVGYRRAGFEVVGVDLAPQPDYPYTFRRREVIGFLTHQARWWLKRFDLVHASPPCQRDAAITKGTNAHLRETYPDLYGPVGELLEELGIPYVIENPASRPDVVLCGEMFGLKVIRHRNFELGGWSAEAPQHKPHRGRVAGMRHGEWFEGPYFAVYGNGGGKGTVPQWQDAMDIRWTDVRKSIAEAIPPAYTEYIGRQFISQLKEEAA